MELTVIFYAMMVEGFSLIKGSYIWANQIDRAFPRILNFILAMAYMVYSFIWCFSHDRAVQSAGVILIAMSVLASVQKKSKTTHRLDALISLACLITVLIVRIGEIA